jgi:DNA primase
VQDAKEEVRARLRIEDVIGEYVQLKRAGRYWRGLSPFTNEKTPSFFVTPEKDIWHDFSSGQGGDIFSFIMKVEGLDFRAALEFLAAKAGVDLSQYSDRYDRSAGDKKRRFIEANGAALRYFQREMIKNRAALDYIFGGRGLIKETVLDWGIGYAPEGGGLIKFLLRKGFKDVEIRGAGLASSRGYEMFRGRMMIPLRDGQGQVVGFTGRIIADGQPKYLNTPATLIYDKGRQVFGLSHSKEAIRAAKNVVIVEGNLDVITSHQAGVKNVVATSGTALTTEHLRSLGRLTRDVRLCFDSDAAGIKATERAIDLAEPLDLKLSVVEVVGAKDPDELIKKAGVEKWKAAIKNARPAVQWLIDQYSRTQNLATADGKKVLTGKVLPVIAKLRDPVEREFYLKQLSQTVDVSLNALMEKLGMNRTPTARRVKLRPVKTQKTAAVSRRDANYLIERILAIAQSQPELATILKNLPDTYLTETTARVKYFLLNPKSVEPDQTLTDKLAELEIVAAQETAAAGQSQSQPRELLLEYLRQLEIVQLDRRREKLAREFAAATDNGKRKLINGALNALNKTLRDLKSSGASDDFGGLRELWAGRKLGAVLK